MSSTEIEERLSPVYERLKLPAGRIEMMTGIKETLLASPAQCPAIYPLRPLKIFLQKNIVKPEDIDLIIHASVCRDYLEPSTSSIVHCNLGLREQTMFFDLSNACLGMMSSFVVAANMIEQGLIKHALIVSGENGGPLLLQTMEHLLKDDSITRKSIKKYIANLTNRLRRGRLYPFAQGLCQRRPFASGRGLDG